MVWTPSECFPLHREEQRPFYWTVSNKDFDLHLGTLVSSANTQDTVQVNVLARGRANSQPGTAGECAISKLLALFKLWLLGGIFTGILILFDRGETWVTRQLTHSCYDPSKFCDSGLHCPETSYIFRNGISVCHTPWRIHLLRSLRLAVLYEIGPGWGEIPGSVTWQVCSCPWLLLSQPTVG